MKKLIRRLQHHRQTSPLNLVMVLLVVTSVSILGYAALRFGRASTVTLSVLPSSQTVTKDTTFSVNIRMNTGTEPVVTLTTDISYPSASLQFMSLNYTGSPFDGSAQQSTSTPGTIKLTRYIVQEDGQPLKTTSGDQLIVKLTFKAIASGTAVVSFNTANTIIYSTQNCNPDCPNILTGTYAGSYTITMPAGSTPSPTSAPTTSPSLATTPPPTSKKSSTPSQPGPATSAPPTSNTSTSNPDIAPPGALTQAGLAVTLTLKDAANHLVKGQPVTLGSVTKVTDAKGQVTFGLLSPGTYTVTVGSGAKATTHTIVVTAKAGQGTPQAFEIRVPTLKSNRNALIGAGAAGLLVVAGGILLSLRLLHRGATAASTVMTTAAAPPVAAVPPPTVVAPSEGSASPPVVNAPSASQPAPGQVVTPTQPPEGQTTEPPKQ